MTALRTMLINSLALPGYSLTPSLSIASAGKAKIILLLARGADAKEMLRKGRDVLAMLSQRRSAQGQDIDTVLEVLTNFSFSHSRYCSSRLRMFSYARYEDLPIYTAIHFLYSFMS